MTYSCQLISVVKPIKHESSASDNLNPATSSKLLQFRNLHNNQHNNVSHLSDLERNILSEGKMIGVGWAAGADDQQQQRRENVIRDNLQRRKCDQTEEKSEFLGEMSRMGLRGSDWSDVDYQWWLRWVSIRGSLWSENTEKILKNYDP